MSILSKYFRNLRGTQAYLNPAGFILAQNEDGPLKWADGPYPIQIHANFQILMGHSKFLWALCKI